MKSTPNPLQSGSVDSNRALAKALESGSFAAHEKEQTERALRASEEQFANAFAYAPIGMALAASSGRCLKVNRAFCQMLGYAEDELLALSVQEFTHPDDMEADLENVRQLLAGAIASYQMEKRYLQKGGAIVWGLLSVSLVRDEAGEPIHVIAQVQDITERKQAEAARFEREQEFEALVENAPDIVSRFDRKFRHLYVNRAVVQATGLPTSAFIGKTHEEMGMPRHLQAKWHAALEAVFASGKERETEFEFPTSGGPRFYHSRLVPEHAPDGRIRSVLNIARDITERKQAEAALSESEERFRTMANSMPQLGWIAHADGFIYWYNQRWYDYTGTTPEAMEGWGWQSVHDPEVLPRVMTEWTEAIATGKAFEMEFPLRGTDGKFRRFLTLAVPIKDAAGYVVQWFGTNTDITASKATEEALRESEAALALAQRVAGLGSWELDLANLDDVNSNSLRWSDETFRIFGFEPNEVEVSNEAFFQAVHPEDRERVATGIAELLRTGTPYSVDHRIILPDGVERIVREDAQVVVDETSKRLLKLVGTVRDITEQRQAQEAIHVQAHLLDQIGQAVIATDTAGSIVYANRFAGELYGWTPEEMRGRNIMDVTVSAATREQADEIMGRLREGECWSGEFLVQLRDGRVFPAWVTNSPLLDEEGRLIGIIGISADITSRKQAEAERDEMHKQLVDASRRAGMAEIATSVLHNVGNVLNSVNISAAHASDKIRQSCSADLTRVAALFQEHREDLPGFLTSAQGAQLPAFLTALAVSLAGDQHVALAELQSLSANIDHIKEIVAMQQSYARMAAVIEALSPASLVESALQLNEAALGRHHVEVIREYAETPLLAVDKHKALQILVNLIRNAKQAMAGVRAEDRRLTLRISSEDDAVVKIAVADAGVGIPAANLARLFEHGFTTRADGHGFGLHSAALAAKELGGALTVHSDGPGKGAVFTLMLPLHAHLSAARKL